MKKKDLKLFEETIRLGTVIIVELTMSILLIRQKKWYSTLAGISFMVKAGDQMGKASKLLDKTTDRLASIGSDTESNEETESGKNSDGIPHVKSINIGRYGNIALYIFCNNNLCYNEINYKGGF